MITHSKNKLTAAANDQGTIIIWDQANNDLGPTIEDGTILTIILNDFENLQQIQWIEDTDELLIRDENYIYFWDIYQNVEFYKEIEERSVLFSKKIDIGYLIVFNNSESVIVKGKKSWSTQSRSSIVMNSPNGVILYPTRYFIDPEEGWTEEELSMSWGNRRLRRRFEGDNDIQINGDFIFLSDDENISDFTLPKAYRHIFDDCGLVIGTIVGESVLLITKNNTVLFNIRINDAVLIPTSKSAVIPVQYQNSYYYIVRENNGDRRIYHKNSKFIISDLNQNFKTQSFNLKNSPPSLYLDYDQDLRFARGDLYEGLLWYPDFEKDHIFIDLFGRDGAIFNDTGRILNSYVQVERERNYVMVWIRGSSYPSGKLLYYDINQPESEPIELYDAEVVSKRISSEEFLDEKTDDVDFPLIIPSWEKIQLHIYYDKLVDIQNLSTSQYYIILESWSKFDGGADMSYPETIPEDQAYVLFGDLSIELDKKDIKIEGICPMWAFLPSHNLLSFYAKDGHCYIVDATNQYLLPIISFKSSLPAQLRFTEDGKYLISISFELRETSIITHPNDEESAELTVEFPYCIFKIADINKEKIYYRSYRFPFKLDNSEITIDYDTSHISISFPSYTDNAKSVICEFDTTKEKFHITNKANLYRFWQTHSKNSPHSKLSKGDQFPVTPHPEIRREYTMRKFHLLEKTLLRKEDNFPISSAYDNTIKISQISTSDLYSLRGTYQIKLPFYYHENMKPIYIQEKYAKYIEGNKHIPLNRIETLPFVYSVKLDLTSNDKNFLKNLDRFISSVLENKAVHSKNGIAYKSPKAEIYRSQLEIERESIETAIDFIEQV